MKQSASSQQHSHGNNAQIILAHGNTPDQDSIDSEQYVQKNNNLRGRTNSTENTKYMFKNKNSVPEGGMRSTHNRNMLVEAQLSFNTEDANQNAIGRQQHRGQVSSSANYQNMIQKDINAYGGSVIGDIKDKSGEKQYSLQQRQMRGQDLQSPGGEYQSILLTRYLKEPKLPPSSTYYNKLSKQKKSTGGASRGPQKPQALTQNGFGVGHGSSTQYKDPQSPAKMMSAPDASKSRKRIIGASGQPHTQGSNVISYRNQKEIMKKIFGNEQNYHQVKNLLVKGPYQADESTNTFKTNIMARQNQTQENQNKSPLAQKQNNFGDYTRQQSDKPSSNLLYNQGLERRQMYGRPIEHQNGTQSPHVGPDEAYLAKSIKRNPSSKLVENVNTGNTSQLTTFPTNSADQFPVQNNDQVEKAIFDLQDVKNNYFQEKSMYDQKIQQIQTKTLTSGFGLNHGNTTYNKTATSGFISTSQRPLTQGGALLRNQQLMNDNNILKGDLESVSKEDLKERLVVAEMVMKKLFQRNKDLEDQIFAAKDNSQLDTHESKSLNHQLQNKRLSMSPVGSPKNLTDLNNLDITADEVDKKTECQSCFDLRRELVSKETEYQERINEMHQQLLKKTEVMGKTSHLDYLQIRLEETMSEAKRHFSNYIKARNSFNNFLESRLNQTNVQGGVKGQKIHNDILNMLKKNLESAEQALFQEKDQLKLSYAKNQAQLLKKDGIIKKRDSKIKTLTEEIERRKFIEKKVQLYVKGLINKNQRHNEFLNKLASGKLNDQFRRQIEEFQRELESEAEVGGQDGGESTENEEDDIDDAQMSDRNISVEVNDL